MSNIDQKVVEGFGQEWAAFDQVDLDTAELQERFDGYFAVFPFDELPADAEGFDLGCGSGRWASLVAPKVGRLHCIDPSAEALDVARRRLAGAPNVDFHVADAAAIPYPDGSQDFGYSLGVLHHIPNTEEAMAACVRKLKPGAPFLVYLYYAFDNRPAWFRTVWQASDRLRRVTAALPFGGRKLVAEVMAATVYWPMTRVALLAERLGADVTNMPLSPYRHYSYYTMRTDALDRMGTQLEHRFTRKEIRAMMERVGLSGIEFYDGIPHWCACGRKAG